jgi:hypothetical protein
MQRHVERTIGQLKRRWFVARQKRGNYFSRSKMATKSPLKIDNAEQPDR